MAFAPTSTVLGIIAEATYGETPDSGTPTFIPVMDPATVPNLKWLQDKGWRGSAGEDYDEVQGVRFDEYTAKVSLYADTFPLLIAALLGGADDVTGMAAPYTHLIKLLYSPSTGQQPPSYSIVDFDGADAFLMAGCRAKDLTITWAADAEVTADFGYVCNPYVSSVSLPTLFDTPSYSEEVMPPGWAASVSIGGAVLNLSSGELKIDRKTESYYTAQGTVQAPRKNFAGPIEVTGKFSGIVESDADPWSTGDDATALNRDQQVVSITFTDPNDESDSTQHSLEFLMTKCQLMDPKRTRGKIYTEIECTFKALMNTTDADTGYGPLQFIAINAVADAYS